MKRKQLLSLFFLLFFIIVCLSGCAALTQIPVTVLEGTFGLLSQLLKIVAKLPKPPPGVF